MTLQPEVIEAGSDLATLVRAAQAGESGAQRQLFDRFRSNLMAYCLVAAHHDRETALDLTQEVFTEVFRHLAQLREPERFAGWLFAIAANHCRRRLVTERKRQERLNLFALEQEVHLSAESGAQEERLRQVEALLQELPDAQLKEIVRLKYSDPEHTTREIASRLSVPHGTVTVKLMRFRARLRRQLLRELVADAAPRSQTEAS